MIPLFERSNSWKSSLKKSDEQKLNEILRKVEKYKNSYSTAKNVKTAQLWCALLEAEKDKEDIENRLRRIEYIINGMIDRATEIKMEKFKEEKDIKSLIRSLEKF